MKTIKSSISLIRLRMMLQAAAALAMVTFSTEMAGGSGLSVAASPDEVALKIIVESPALFESMADVVSAEQSLKSAANLPDPEIEGEYLVGPSGVENRWGAGLSWGLEWPGVYSARKQEARGQLQAARSELLVKRNEMLTEVGRLLLDYILASSQLQLYSEIEAANDSVAKLAERGFKGGEMTRLDLGKLKIERAALATRIAESENARQAAADALALIHGGDCSELLSSMDIAFPEAIAPSVQQMKEALVSSPEVMAAYSRLEQARLTEKVAARESLPEISIGYQHAYEEGTHFNGATLGFSIPVFSNSNKKRAAKVETGLANTRLEIATERVKLSLDRDVARLNQLNTRIESLSKALAADDELALLQKAYSGGVITLIEYINERNYFLEARMDLLSLRHAAALARLDIHSLLPSNL